MVLLEIIFPDLKTIIVSKWFVYEERVLGHHSKWGQRYHFTICRGWPCLLKLWSPMKCFSYTCYFPYFINYRIKAHICKLIWPSSLRMGDGVYAVTQIYSAQVVPALSHSVRRMLERALMTSCLESLANTIHVKFLPGCEGFISGCLRNWNREWFNFLKCKPWFGTKTCILLRILLTRVHSASDP